ncbi:glycosyl transferase family 1 [Sphingomonas piscis]|uniref:Glycosyl transferase family 1 n=1 Tax=Sphingomonas piscis TaxID=2714943 RepID=A0A6G7YSE0_9SPHN|nr:nucleotide disphospho-sugar-binding domain-containing protein [Sphingomonas piscis]QIK79657.1 glycosyl transferase family 1 [Sphingomonas piscis]
MAYFGFTCPPLPGHINPMTVLARELATRGHRVTFLGFPDMRRKLSPDLEFRSFGESDWPDGSLEPFLKRLGKLGGPLSLRRLILDLADFADTVCRDLPGALEELKPDALIVDQADAAGSLVARAIGLPYVNVANALPLNMEPGVPPPVLAWPYDPTPKGIRRNLGGYRVARFIERPITKVIRRHAVRLGQPDVRFAEDTLSEVAQLTQCVRGLDFPRERLPANFHYVGPLRERDQPMDLGLPNDGKPLVFCSLGTLQGSRLSIFRAVAKAVQSLDLRLLIAHGGMLSERQSASLPGDPMVRSFVPQRAVLAKSALAITHCGFNTVMDALSFGVPMVGMPLAFEQPATGARLERAGVGEVLYRWRTPGRIRDAVAAALADPAYRVSAAALQAEIALAGGVRRAADIIERATGAAPPEGATRGRAARGGARGDSRSESS